MPSLRLVCFLFFGAGCVWSRVFDFDKHASPGAFITAMDELNESDITAELALQSVALHDFAQNKRSMLKAYFQPFQSIRTASAKVPAAKRLLMNSEMIYFDIENCSGAVQFAVFICRSACGSGKWLSSSYCISLRLDICHDGHTFAGECACSNGRGLVCAPHSTRTRSSRHCFFGFP